MEVEGLLPCSQVAMRPYTGLVESIPKPKHLMTVNFIIFLFKFISAKWFLTFSSPAKYLIPPPGKIVLIYLIL